MNREFEETTIRKRAITITTVFTVVTVLVFLVLVAQVVTNNTAALPVVSVIGLGAMGLLAFTSALGGWYCRNGRINLGVSLVGSGLLFVVLAIPFITKGRASYTSPLAVAVIIATAPQIFSARIANRIVILSVFVGITAVLLDIWLPFTRTPPNIQPYALFVFAGGLLVFMIYTALQYRKFRLQTKLLSTFVFIPLIIVSVVGIFLILRISNQQRTLAEERVQFVLQSEVDELQGFVSEAEVDIQLLSNTFVFEHYLSLLAEDASPEAVAVAKQFIQNEFLNFAQSRLFYDQIRFLDANGQEVVRVDTDSNGVSTVIPEAELQNKASRPYFVETAQLNEGEVFISPLELNVERGEIERPFTPVLRYGTPIFKDGELQGVIITNVLADYFLAPLAGDLSDVYLIDSDGYFLLHPDESKRWGRDLETGVVVGQELPEIATSLQRTAPGPFSQQTPTELFAHAPIYLNNDTEPRWFLLMATPLEEVLAPLNETLEPIQYVFTIALMLTPLVAIFVSQSFALPIIRLTEAAEQMGQGNFDVPIQVESNDEVGALAGILKLMNTQLAELIGSLEARVEARTRDLTLAVDVSHQVTQVQTLELLLTNAVTLIRDRFDLYYTQIYLVEGRSLWLKAGTGEVGKHLVEQGHRLPVGPGSINGTAVSEKRPLIVADTADSPLFRANPLLPDTRSEMAVPLIVNERVVGVLNLQSAEPNALTEDNLFAFEILATQLASAIENARLFTEVAEAQSAVEAQVRRLTRQGWESFLDGIYQREFMGYVYEDGKVTAVSKPVLADANHQKWEIQLLDETLGQVVVAPDPEKPLTPAAAELIHIVSQQVGQQIENLRLLADARRYQEEAEAIAHRLIRDGWESYQEETAVIGYTYDQQEVQPLLTNHTTNPATEISQFLAVGGETIGEISLAGVDVVDDQTREIIAAVTAQLGTHIENLRLSQQSEIARADAEKRNQELAVINSIVTQIATSFDLQYSLQIIVDEMALALEVDQVRIALLKPDKETLTVIAEHYDQSRTSSALGMEIPMAGNTLTQYVIDHQKMVIVEDAQNDPQTAPVHHLFRQQGIETVILIPLVVADEVIGTIGLDILEKRVVDINKLKFAETIVYQAATAVQNSRLFEQTQAALAETEMLYAYSSQLNTATNLSAVLDSAVAPGFESGAADALLLIYDQNTNGNPKYAKVMAAAPKDSIPLGTQLYLPEQPTRKLWPTGGKNIVFVGDVNEDGRLNQQDKEAFRQMNVQAVAILFLMVGNLRLGQIMIRWDKQQTFTNVDERLYGAIAQQASSVVYNRLLFNQTEEALSETAALYQASADLNTAQSFEQVLTALRQHTILGQGSSDVSLNFFDCVWEKDQIPENVDVLARWSRLPIALPNRYKLASFPEAKEVLRPDEWLICEDVVTDVRMGEETRAIFMERFKARSLLYIPLVVGGQWIGFLNGVYAQPTQFPEAQIRRLNVLARQAAVSIQSIRLLQQTERRAQREALINNINQKIQAAPTVQTALQTAVSELGQALKLKKAVIELATNGQKNGRDQE